MNDCTFVAYLRSLCTSSEGTVSLTLAQLERLRELARSPDARGSARIAVPTTIALRLIDQATHSIEAHQAETLRLLRESKAPTWSLSDLLRMEGQ